MAADAGPGGRTGPAGDGAGDDDAADGAADDLWVAPAALGPVRARVSVPGSKSLTNRALVLASLAEGPTAIRAPLRSRDTDLMAGGLRRLGVGVVDEADGGWTVTPAPLTGEVSVDVGNAGTVLRFLPPVACLADGPVRFDGDPRVRERPLGPLVEALRHLGADIEAGERGGVPLVVHGFGGLPGGEVSLDASSSSQLVSGLLLAAPRFERGVVVRHEGPALPSLPHIAMTVAALRAAGVEVDDAEPDVWRVEPGAIAGGEVVVEPDLSNAAPFLAAALVTGGEVGVADWPPSTTQPGDRLRDLLGAMGAAVSSTDGGTLVVAGPVDGAAGLRGLDVDLHDCGELAPVLAALAALAPEPSSFRGIAHLRAHETDRLAALVLELGRLGLRAFETGDGLLFTPVPAVDRRPGVVQTYDDHRLATAAAVLGLVVPGVRVRNMATTAKTMPDFVERWTDMLSGGGGHAKMVGR